MFKTISQKKMPLFLPAFFLLFFFLSQDMGFAAPNKTNALNGIDRKSKGVGWTEPGVLEGEPVVTGYSLHINSVNNPTNSQGFKNFVVVDTNGVPIESELIISTNETGIKTYSYYWEEYPFEVPTNGISKFWLWVTASNITGAVSTYSDYVTFTIETVRPSKPENFRPN